MEQDFGSMEGKKWTDRLQETKIPGGGKEFVEVESKDSMSKRADAFLDEHLLLLLDDISGPDDLAIAIVSHGIFLSTLWKRLLKRLPSKSVTLCLDANATPHPSLEHLGGWSNTGYLELHMTKPTGQTAVPLAEASKEPSETQPVHEAQQKSSSPTAEPVSDAHVSENNTIQVNTTVSLPTGESSLQDPIVESRGLPVTELRIARGWSMNILTINGKDHLKGLKRTGGGVGSSRHDASQKTIETFFKRRKME